MRPVPGGRGKARAGFAPPDSGRARQTRRRRVGPKGELRPDGEKWLALRRRGATCG